MEPRKIWKKSTHFATRDSRRTKRQEYYHSLFCTAVQCPSASSFSFSFFSSCSYFAPAFIHSPGARRDVFPRVKTFNCKTLIKIHIIFTVFFSQHSFGVRWLFVPLTLALTFRLLVDTLNTVVSFWVFFSSSFLSGHTTILFFFLLSNCLFAFCANLPPHSLLGGREWLRRQWGESLVLFTNHEQP